MESGGDLLLGDYDRLLHAINKRDSGIHGWEQLRCVQPPEGLLGHLQDFPDQRGSGLHALVPLACRRPQPHGGEGRFDHVRRAQMPPVGLRELIKRDQPFPVGVCQRSTAFGASIR